MCPAMPQVTDRRFGALKTLGERKAAFHEYVAQRKKEAAEEARQARMQVSRAALGAGAGLWLMCLSESGGAGRH